MVSPRLTPVSYFNPRSPRGERRSAPTTRASAPNFNPRSPRGERLLRLTRTPGAILFQSTLPARGATPPTKVPIRDNKFQSTLPARGATGSDYELADYLIEFQSTLPARGATANVHRFLDKICTVCINNRAFFAQCLIQTTSNAESVGKTRCYFGANLQAFIDSLYFALLQNQHFFWHIRGFASKMLYFVFVMVPKIIET